MTRHYTEADLQAAWTEGSDWGSFAESGSGEYPGPTSFADFVAALPEPTEPSREYTDEQLRKAPGWVQRAIKRAEGEAAVAKRELVALQDSQEKTSVMYGDIWQNPKYLPDGMHDTVRFLLDHDGHPDDRRWIDVRRDSAEAVHISSSSGLMFSPNASNTATVTAKVW